ncbi:dienelactone hydrolase family protein, partial [Chloroflexota bacterium]
VLRHNNRGSIAEEMVLDLPSNSYVDDVQLTWVVIQSRIPELRFDAYLVEPPEDRRNGWGVVAIHGHGSSAEKMVGFGQEDYTRRMALRLARQGFWVIVPNVTSDEDLNNTASTQAALYGYTLNGIMVEFIQSTLDVAQDRGYQKIGLMGISNGAFLSLLTAGLDDRPDFVVASGILHPFYKNVLAQINKTGKQYFFYFNGPFWLEFDVAELGFLVAPRPLIFTVGTEDKVVEGWESEYSRVRTVYEKLQIPERLGLVQFHGSHELDEDHTIQLLSEWVEKKQ